MRIPILLSCLFSMFLGAFPAAQTPAAQPPAAPAPAPGTPPQPTTVRKRPAAGPSVPATVTIMVTDKTGAPVADVKVSTSGDVAREAQTTAGGVARFLSVKPGDYRLRFERDGFIALERDVTVKSGLGLDVNVTMSPAPAPPPRPAEPAGTHGSSAPPGEARSLVVADFADSNRLNGRDPIRSDQLGCTASAKTSLVQIRDDVPEKSLADADEVIYVVAGQGTLRLGNKDVPLSASVLAVVPRGTVRSLARSGKNPLIVLSVVSGPPCTR